MRHLVSVVIISVTEYRLLVSTSAWNDQFGDLSILLPPSLTDEYWNSFTVASEVPLPTPEPGSL
jgi:hypothetical protein